MQEKLIVVKNADGNADSVARVIVQNDIDYTPKVSVIIPVYNTEDYLRECLDSIVGQTLEEIEIICVDDGSTDKSLEILKEYAKKDRRMTILAQKNLHAGVARNAGIAVARGEYLHFFDSDDWLSLDGYQRIIDILSDKDVDFCKFRNYAFDNVKKELMNDGYCHISSIKDEFFDSVLNIREHTNVVMKIPDSPWSGLYRRSFVVEHDIRFDSLKISNDVSFFCKCAVLAKKIYLSSEYVCYYRRNVKGSLIDIRMKHFHIMIDLFKIVEKIVANSEERVRKRVLLVICHKVKHFYENFFVSSIDDIKLHKFVVDTMKEFMMCYGKNYLDKNYSRQFTGKVINNLSVKNVKEVWMFGTIVFRSVKI